MGIIKDLSDNSIGKIIDTATDVALEGLEKLSQMGFTDYSEIQGISRGDSNLDTKEEIMSELERAPLNIELRGTLMRLNQRDFELKMSDIHKEILEALK